MAPEPERGCARGKGASRSIPECFETLRLVFDTAALRSRFMESFGLQMDV